MTVLQQQYELLRERYPEAELRPLPDGSAAVVIPRFPLPSGWNQPHATVRFLTPVGYPMAKPDCFWTDATLRLANGAPPQSSNMNPMPGVPEPSLWFSWHVAQWNPNRDNLLSYVRVIDSRLRPPR